MVPAALEINPTAAGQLNLATVQEGRESCSCPDRDARQHLDAVVYTTLVHVQWIAGVLAFGVLMIRVD